jgi:hypothetical protein
MAATSNHYGDVTNWIEKVIDSCETSSQEASARRLVRQFEIQYRNIDDKFNWALTGKLNAALNNKFQSRMDKLFEKIKNPE